MNPKLQMLLFLTIFLLSAVIFLYAFMVWNDSFNKAQMFDQLVKQNPSITACKYIPTCICSLVNYHNLKDMA